VSGEQLPAVNTWVKLIEIKLLICTNGYTGPAGGGAGRAVGLAGQPAGHRRHRQQDILGPATPLGAGVPQGSFIYVFFLLITDLFIVSHTGSVH
jgi:hypothetical protein